MAGLHVWEGVDKWGGQFACPYGLTGNRLWVREAHVMWPLAGKDGAAGIIYRASAAQCNLPDDAPRQIGRQWRSPIFMRRADSRITLEITDVRVERIQDISEEDAQAEGVQPIPFTRMGWPAGDIYRDAFAEGWDKLNAKRGYSWDNNPWTWAISFQRVFPV